MTMLKIGRYKFTMIIIIDYFQNCSLNIIHPTAFLNLVLMIELDLSHNNIRYTGYINTHRVECQIKSIYIIVVEYIILSSCQ